MITDIVKSILQFFDTLYTNLGVSSFIADLIDKLDKPFEFIGDFSYYISGVYYVFGKSLVMYVIGVITVILAIRIILAVVNLAYP